MNEKDLNIEYICEKTLLAKDDELVPIILDLIQESYKAGLCQAEYDNAMDLIEENQKLNKQLEEERNKVREYSYKLSNYRCEETYENQQKEFIEYLENEKDRLARECSHIYEDSLGKTRLVSEDIFNEVDKNLSKYQEIIGGRNE